MTLFKRFLVALLLMLPLAAFAATINPAGGANAWPLHVMGNGSTIAAVLESIKLVLNPKVGGGSFRMLLMFIAMTGFCILAIQAGFNPGQNLFKMFSYILVVWVVTFSTTTMTANVMVSDKVKQTDTVVTGVPAIVALPASIVSEVGNWLTETIQQAYSTPDDFSLTKGGFDLFNKMKQDMGQYVITDQNLKQSMTAYITDCAVPAIARGSPSANELLQSPNLIQTLGNSNVASSVLLTRYFYQFPGEPPTSIVESCDKAYANLVTKLNDHATQLLNAASAQWAATGTMTPFANVMQDWMEMAHVGTSPTSGGASYGSPADLVLQKSLINTMAGDFRQAAVQSGNTEVLMGQSITQAEQSQKSGWVTSAMIFQNMMGYVYTTLQAFIFAIVPIMVVAFLIPGLGKKIFVNYGQVLIWLTLWEPMLSIVNYLVTLFGMQDTQTLMATGNSGFSMANEYLSTEQGNNLTIAASFLATMVPLLCWGLVNGAMAFTEFISHGIGSSFAMQAGAQAATGNVSLNSMGMNNLSSNKFDNSHKATVGNQSVMAFENAGTFLSQNNGGGHAADANGAGISAKRTRAETSGSTVAEATNASQGDSSRHGGNVGDSLSRKSDSATTDASNTGLVRSNTAQSGVNADQKSSHGTKDAKDKSHEVTEQTAIANQKQVGAHIGTGMQFKSGGGAAGGAAAAAGAAGPGAAAAAAGAAAKKKGLPFDAKAGLDAGATNSATATMGASTKQGTTQAEDFSKSESLGSSASKTRTDQQTAGRTNTKTHTEGGSHGTSAGTSTSAESASQVGHSATRTDSSGASYTRSMDWNAGVTDDMISVALASENDMVSLADRQAAMDRFYGSTADNVAAARGTVSAGRAALQGAGASPVDNNVLGTLAAPSMGLLNGMATTLNTEYAGLMGAKAKVEGEFYKRQADFGPAATDLTRNVFSIDTANPGGFAYHSSGLGEAAVGGSIVSALANSAVSAYQGAAAKNAIQAAEAAATGGTAAAAGGTAAAAATGGETAVAAGGAASAGGVAAVAVPAAAVTGALATGVVIGYGLDHIPAVHKASGFAADAIWNTYNNAFGHIKPSVELVPSAAARLNGQKH